MFKRATRKKVKLRLSIAGLSGSGKTWSALEIATGMFPSGKIALLDTEAGRGDLYAENFVYDSLLMEAPYSPDKYIKAIRDAERSGYDILIIDSLSHAWAGDGGVLSIVERASTGGQTFQNGWKKGTPEHNSLVEAIVQSKLHIIATLRSKADYVVELNEKGKYAPRKVGLAPVQRDGLEYEFTICMDMNHENIAHITKDNTQLFNQQYIVPSSIMGEQIMRWLNSGIDEEQQFKEKILGDILYEISNSKDLKELESIYIPYYKKYAEKFSQHFVHVIKAKDDMKSKLLNQDIPQ
jgi:hypothetical protein